MQFPERNTEQVLLSQVAAGDSHAFSLMYQEYSDSIFATVMAYVKDEEEAREIVQQIFVKLWESRAQLSNVKNLKDYFFIATRNNIFNFFNTLTRRNRLTALLQQLPEDATNNPEELFHHKEYQELLQNAVANLPVRQKTAYLLFSREGWSYDKIADNMGLSRYTVKKHLELARRSVRTHISSYFGPL